MKSFTLLELITATGTVLAALASCWAARAAAKAASATQELVDTQTGPLVNVYIIPRPDEPDMAVWVIENIGFSAARNITFEFDDNCYGIYDDETKNHDNIPEKHPFKNGIVTLPPKYELIYNINTWPNIDPRKFRIKWHYESERGKKYHSEYTWDCLKESKVAGHTPPLTRIARSLERIAISNQS